MELESTLPWPRGKSNRKRLYKPKSACRRGGRTGTKCSATPHLEDALPAGRALPPLPACSPSPQLPSLQACLGFILLPQPGSFCCSKCTWAAQGACAVPLCSGLKLLQSNFFFPFVSGRALELCSRPLLSLLSSC